MISPECVCVHEAERANRYSEHHLLCSNEAQDEHDIGPDHSVYAVLQSPSVLIFLHIPSHRRGHYF